MTRTTIEAVIFDCDGTLVDSEAISSAVLAELVAEYDIALTAREAIDRFSGRKMADCVAELNTMGPRTLPDAFTAEFRVRMGEAFERDLLPMKGAEALLEALTLPTCVASSGPRAKIEHTLGLTGLIRFFHPTRIFSAYELGSWKPEPDLFLHAAAALGVEPERCAVVEDSLSGVQAGLAAGMTVFGLQGSAATPPLLDGVVPLHGLDRLPGMLT
ncbi:MAG: HAD-IA family hydrolase [Planctomycetota bacterium]|jgi:HAD superfamily hydrolase (TIGR01509 family)